MRFCILGPLEVRTDNGDEIAVTGPQQRHALAVLLLRAGQPCARDWLAEALWADRPPAGPETALRTCVYGLRKALGRDGSRLETHPSGYRMHVIAGELDLVSWTSLHVQGRAALDRRDAAGAARLLQQGLDLWREPPLLDLPSTRVIIEEADRLLGQRRDAQDALMDARLALGHHHAVVGDLRGTVTADPLNEHAWAQLMLALYRCGRQAEALAAYTRLRSELAREFGVEPSPEVQHLLTQILGNDRALAVPAAAARPGGEPPPPWIPVCQLPAEPPDFTGRAAAAAELARRLPGPAVAVAVIRGLAGAGKTSLALHVAHQVRPRFPDGQLYARLDGPDGPRDPQDVLAEMLRALGVPPDGIPAAGWEREAMYRSMLAGRKVLVVVDDATAAAQVRPLLPGTAGSAVLVTSRSGLADLDGAYRVEAGPLTPAEAAALLAKIIGRERAQGAADAAADIAAACGYLPLPLRIAGARLAEQPRLPLAVLARALADPARVLGELVVGDQSVRERIAVSYRSADPRAQRAWRLLAVHAPEPWPAWLPPALLGEPRAASLAGQLAEAGLVLVTGGASAPRHEIPPLWRAYAREQLRPAELSLTSAARECVYGGWLELADQADRYVPRLAHLQAPPRVPRAIAPAGSGPSGPEDAAAWFADERLSLRAVTERALGEGRSDLAADLAERQLAYLCAHGRHDEAGQLWTAVAAAAAASGDSIAAARAWYRLAVTDADRGRWRRAARRLRAPLVTFGMARDHLALADAQCLAARCAEADWDLTAALRYARGALDSARQAADPRLTCLSQAVLATVLAAEGRGQEGVGLGQEAVELARELAEPVVLTLAESALRRARLSAQSAAPSRLAR